MRVTKRDGSLQAVDLNRITMRIAKLCDGLDRVDPLRVAVSVVKGVFDLVKTTQLDQLAVETAAALLTQDYQYGKLAARIAVSSLHKSTPALFSECIEQLHRFKDSVTGASGVLDPALYAIVQQHKAELDAAVKPERDYEFSLFGLSTLQRSYLLKNDSGEIVERPGFMQLRVALGIHGKDIKAALRTYDGMSRKLFTHATPTLFNAGTKRPQLASCFLLGMTDSIEGIYKTLADAALISKNAGGIGLSITEIRSSQSLIAGTGGTSNGLLPLLRVFNASSRYVDQGGNKRPGSIAVYLEPHHSDIFDLLDLRKNTGEEHARARDLFTALWVSDLFMQRVEEDGEWSLFSSSEAPGLSDVYGEAYKVLYEKHEAAGLARRSVKARELWNAIVTSQIETGTPYVVFKDAVNQKSNQSNLGTIKCSNLCAEIVQYTATDEIAVCNLASINVSAFVSEDGSSYDFQALADTAAHVTHNLNRVIDVNFYPVPEAETSNLRHRPLGLGIQGLATTFFKRRLPFESKEALELSTRIAEAVYYGACTASVAEARQYLPYFSFAGSPASKGKLQFDMWHNNNNSTPTTNFDWRTLKENMAVSGLRNSLLTAQMPTASTASILGLSESVEALASNLYLRRTSAGEFTLLNEFMVDDLRKAGQWTQSNINQILADEGSVQNLNISAELKELYKTTWEIKQKAVIDMAAARGCYLDQSQSMNLFVANPNLSKVSSMLFYAWKQGLKTGIYYLRSKAKVSPIKFTVDTEQVVAARAGVKDDLQEEAARVCTRAMREAGCESCSG